jgi:hypothetical protein
MTTSFDPAGASVRVECYVTGPLRTLKAVLILDTGASVTVLRSRFLASLGLTPAANAPRRRLRSATGGGSAPTVVLRQLLALGVTRADFPVAAYDPPPPVTADGLLGLDFLRGRVLTLDFARGRVGLRSPRRWWPWG